MDMSSLLLATGGHQIEAAETLIEVGRFIVILFAARAHVGPEQVQGINHHSVTNLQAVAKIGLLALLFLSRTADPSLDWLLDRLRAPGEVVVAAFLVLSLSCFAAQAFGLEAALGASRHRHAIESAVKPLVALLATFLVVLIGSGMDLSLLNPFNAASHQGLVLADAGEAAEAMG